MVICKLFNYFYLKIQVSRKLKILEGACIQKEFIFLYQITPLGFSNIIYSDIAYFSKYKSNMSSFKSNENIHKKEDGSYYVVSANKASSATL